MSTSQSIKTLIRAFLAVVLAAFWLLLNPQLAQAQQGEINTGNRIAEKLKNLKLPVLGKKDSSATEEEAEEEEESEEGPSDDSAGTQASESPTSSGIEPGGSSDSSAGTGKKKGVFNRFLSAFRTKKSGEDSAESQSVLEVQRKVSQLERDSLRNYDRNRLSEAKKNLNDLITLRPYEVNYHFALALCFRKENRTQDALKKYQDVIDLGGPKPLIHLLMAEAKTRKGTKKEIFKELEQAATARNIFHDVNILKALQKYNTDTDFIKLALSLERIELVSKRNQDPMTNLFRERLSPTGDGKLSDPDDDKDDLPIEGQKQLYADARKAYEKVIWLIKLEDEEGAMENYGILNAKLAKAELVTIPRIRHDFQRLASMMEELESQIEGIRLKYYYRQALDKLKIMKQAFYDAEYAQVESIFTQVKKLAEDMEETNDQYKPVAAQVLKAGNVWIERTRVRQEFDANKPQIQGVIISSQSKQVVINGRIVPQGDRIGKFKVQKVENNKITFRYKGEEIPLIFRRY